MKKKLCSLAALFALALPSVAAIDTPYESTFVLKQINSAAKESARLCQIHRKFDRQPTGFYLDALGTVKVKVEVLTPAADGAMPSITVGTLGFNVGSRSYTASGNSGTYHDFPLTAGNNTIKLPAGDSGGLIYFRYATEAAAAPTGEVRITFLEESEHRRAPKYVRGVTTYAEFQEMLTAYDTPDVTYITDYAVICATKEAANAYSRTNDKNAWLKGIDDLLAQEDDISGLSDSDPNPLHHRMKPGTVRYLLVENTSSSPHANSVGYTGYPNGSRARYLTAFGSSNDVWMVAHEVGHQHQQSAYRIPQSTESTVNIYSYVAKRALAGAATYYRTPNTKWTLLWNNFMTLPLSERLYDMDDTALKTLVGFDYNEFRFCVWEQLFLLFGDEFYRRLHRVVREEQEGRAMGDDSRYYLIWKASQVSGYDLRDYFAQYGIRILSTPALQEQLDRDFEKALAAGAIVPPPRTTGELTHVTGQNLLAGQYSWLPLPLRGITAGSPDVAFPNRSSWTIRANKPGAYDTSGYGDKPEYILDGSTASFFSFVKPGSSYGGVTPGSYTPEFVIDMQTPQLFNALTFSHRSDHTSQQQTMLRATNLSVYGSLTDGNWQPLAESKPLSVTATTVSFELPDPVTCRYVRVVINDWGRSGGSTIQISEFSVGTTRWAVETPASLDAGKPVDPRAGGVYYDLSGRRVANPTKGIYLIDGKKVVF